MRMNQLIIRSCNLNLKTTERWNILTDDSKKQASEKEGGACVRVGKGRARKMTRLETEEE